MTTDPTTADAGAGGEDRHAPGCPARGTTGFSWACNGVDCAPKDARTDRPGRLPVTSPQDAPEVSL